MKSQLFVILILSGICFSFIQPARSEVIHGVAGINMAYDDMYSGINWNEAFDFSTQTIATLDIGDLSWGLTIRGLPYLMFRDCYVTIAPGTLEELSVAPEKLQGPYGGYGFDVGPGVYVIKTSDGLYVKFDNLSYILNNTYYVTLEYYVQTDGSPNFGPSVAVEPTTWGRVKALYR